MRINICWFTIVKHVWCYQTKYFQAHKNENNNFDQYLLKHSFIYLNTHLALVMSEYRWRVLTRVCYMLHVLLLKPRSEREGLSLWFWDVSGQLMKIKLNKWKNLFYLFRFKSFMVVYKFTFKILLASRHFLQNFSRDCPD